MSDESNNLTEEPVAADPADPTLQETGAPVEPAPTEQEEVSAEAAAEAESPPAGAEDESDNGAESNDGADSDESVAESHAGEGDAGEGDTGEGDTGEGGTGEGDTGEGDAEAKLDWYILKVQSNREKSISEALQRRVSVEGLDEFFDEIIVPTEMVTEFKGGKKRVVRRKLYPGYILVHMHINDDTWFAVRETPGIGDFTGSGGKPTPMLPHEVQRIVSKQEEKTDEAPKLKINFKVGDQVKINEGTFASFEGEVSTLDETSGRVIVMINIFGRSTPVELEYWQIETV